MSQKLFVAREYVLKHIRLKHTEKVDAQRDRVRPCMGSRLGVGLRPSKTWRRATTRSASGCATHTNLFGCPVDGDSANLCVRHAAQAGVPCVRLCTIRCCIAGGIRAHDKGAKRCMAEFRAQSCLSDLSRHFLSSQ